MGTPGDKTQINKVVKIEPDEWENVPGDVSRPVAPGIASRTIAPGVSLPQFSTFLSVDFQPSTSELANLNQGQPANLNQGHIDYYFPQTKCVLELPTLFNTLPEKNKTFQFESQPGPSGIQTPKSKPLSSIARIKKIKPAATNTPKRLYTCNVCKKTYASSSKLAKHQHSHTGTSPFKCDDCKKTFSSKFKLVRHELIHSDQKPYLCSVCERTFHRKDHLKNHFKVHSPSKEIYSCEKPNCKKEYTSQLSFKKHLAYHSAEEGNLQCQICNNIFSEKSEIIYHLKIHAGSRSVKNPSEKKYDCDLCKRKFFTKKDVRRHLVVHTGRRDFLCQFCPQRFGRKDHLVRHIKKSHNFKYESDEGTSTKTAIKTETITSYPDSNNSRKLEEFKVKEEVLANPEDYPPNVDIFSVSRFLDLLPSSSTQEELKDLGSEILEGIGESTNVSMESDDNYSEPIPTDVLNNPAIARLLEPSEENMPLPPFGKTFQPPK